MTQTLDTILDEKGLLTPKEQDIVLAAETIVAPIVPPPEKMPPIDDDGYCKIQFSKELFCEFNIRAVKKFVRFCGDKDRGGHYSRKTVELKCNYEEIADIVQALKDKRTQIQDIAGICIS